MTKTICSGLEGPISLAGVCVEEMGTDGNVCPDFMRCKVCYKHPLYADKRSPFFVGSSSFRIDPVKKHTIYTM